MDRPDLDPDLLVAAAPADLSFPLSLLTLNLGLLAWGPLWAPICAHGPERLAAAPALLRAAGADVVALQEVYTARHRRLIAEALGDLYPHAAAPETDELLLGCGLMLLSRYPIIGQSFTPLPRRPGMAARLSRPGCQRVLIDLPGAEPVAMVNTHLPAFAENRQRQSEAAHLLGVGEDAILLGDFNCSPAVDADVYRRILWAGYRDAFAEVQAGEPATWDAANPLNRIGPHRDAPSQRIDHVFLPQRFRTMTARICLTEPAVAVTGGAVPLSDHYGLMVRVLAQGA